MIMLYGEAFLANRILGSSQSKAGASAGLDQQQSITRKANPSGRIRLHAPGSSRKY